MGAWGTGLYSNDYAVDLRSTVSAVVRLPVSEPELISILRTSEAPANDPSDQDHTTFWLVVADQFARRGLVDSEAKARALEIIDGETHLTTLRSLGADDRALRQTAAKLALVRRSLLEATPKPRKTLAKPQPLIFAVGDVLVYPVGDGGRLIRPNMVGAFNPYFVSRDKDPKWTVQGWSAAVVIRAERHIDYLAWYAVLTVGTARDEPHTMRSLWSEPSWGLRGPGTCSTAHRQRMEIETIGSVEIDHDALIRRIPDVSRVSGRHAAVADISISNNLAVAAQGKAPGLSLMRDWMSNRVGGLSEVARPSA